MFFSVRLDKIPNLTMCVVIGVCFIKKRGSALNQNIRIFLVAKSVYESSGASVPELIPRLSRFLQREATGNISTPLCGMLVYRRFISSTPGRREACTVKINCLAGQSSNPRDHSIRSRAN